MAPNPWLQGSTHHLPWLGPPHAVRGPGSWVLDGRCCSGGLPKSDGSRLAWNRMGCPFSVPDKSFLIQGPSP